MLPSSRDEILRRLDPGDLVLEIGGWADPFERADWVLDLMPYETRGEWGGGRAAEGRLRPDRWVTRDACERTPYPFEDDQFDFVICSQTLEDLRDPVWVCSEMVRVGRAGYLEVPSRMEEQTRGLHGPWVGWSHHRWLCDVDGEAISFVHKPGALQGRAEAEYPRDRYDRLGPEERVQRLFWEGGFEFGERIFIEPDELDAYLLEVVPGGEGAAGPAPGAPGRIQRTFRSLRGR